MFGWLARGMRMVMLVGLVGGMVMRRRLYGWMVGMPHAARQLAGQFRCLARALACSIVCLPTGMLK